jgi:hypothetical protein
LFWRTAKPQHEYVIKIDSAHIELLPISLSLRPRRYSRAAGSFNPQPRLCNSFNRRGIVVCAS